MSSSHRRRGRPDGVAIDGDRLRAARKRRQLTQAELAAFAAVTERTLQRAEATGRASDTTLRALCEVLAVPLVSLLRPTAEEITERLDAVGLAPRRPPARWVTRAQPETALHEALEEPSGFIIIGGCSGVGKTALAQRVVADHVGSFPGGTVWLDLEGGHSEARLRSLYLSVARTLGFEAEMPEPHAASTDELGQSFRHHFWTAQRLLVLDGVNVPEIIERFWHPGAPGVLLVTSSRRHVAASFAATVLVLERMPSGEARALLTRFVPSARLGGDPAGTSRLLDIAAGHPRYLCMAGATLRREELTSASDYAERLATGIDLARPEPGGDATDAAIIDRLRALLSPDCWEVYEALTLFGTEAFPLRWAAALLGLPEQELRRHVSELVDAYLVRVVRTGTGGDTWVTLQRHNAWLFPSLLSEPRRLALEAALDSFLADEISRQHADGIQAAWVWYLRHESLVVQRVTQLITALDAEGSILTVARIDEVPDRSGAPLARRLSRVILELSAILMTKGTDYAPKWLYAGLAAVSPRAATLDSARLRYSTAWWRTFSRAGTFGNDIEWVGTSWESLAAAGEPEAAAWFAGHLAPHYWVWDPASDWRWIARSARAFQRGLSPSVDVAMQLNGIAVGLAYGPPSPESWRESAAICDDGRRVLSQLEDGTPSRWPRAVLALNRATFRVRAGEEGAAAEVDVAVREALTHLPEDLDILRAALIAHGAHFGAALGYEDVAAASAAARELWWRGTRDCSHEEAPRVTWVLHSMAMMLVLKMLAPHHPAAAGDIARLGLSAPSVQRAPLEVRGLEAMAALSIDAMAPLFDGDYIAMALHMADHATYAVRYRADLGTLQELLAQTA